MNRIVPLFAFLTLIPFAHAQTPATNAPPIRQISETVFQLGDVQFDKSKKTVQFPAFLNMNDGLIEYLIVTTKGKTHESLLKTTVEPYHIQLAMLLLGAKGAPLTPEQAQAASAPFHVNNPAGATNPPIAGDPISIELAWNEKSMRAEDCLINLLAKTNVIAGPWTFSGSRVAKGTFIAQRDGSIAALIDDLDAMVNNPRAGHDNDQIWQVNSNSLPPLNTPVQVTFKLEQHENITK